MSTSLIEDLKLSWERTPRPVRIIVALSVILNSTSLASVAENIVKWKGFLRDGLEFYQSLTVPLVTLLGKIFSVQVPRWHFDFLVVYLLILSVDFRTLRAWRRFNDEDSRKQNVIDGVFLVAALLVVPAAFVSGRYVFWEWEPFVFLLFLLLLIIGGPAIMVVAGEIDRRRGTELSPENSELVWRSKMFFVALASSILFVALLAAINKGIWG